MSVVVVVEESIARLVAGRDALRLTVVPRRRRRGRGWMGLDADRVVAALDNGQGELLVLARDADADPGARALRELARVMGRDLVPLPAAPEEAAWTVAVAVHDAFQGDGLVRRLEALVGEMAAGGPLPRRILSPGTRVPALRPAALARWAGCAWRACPVCAGGGPAGGRCARCGARP